MLQLFMQVPLAVTTQMAKRCTEVFEVAERLKALSENTIDSMEPGSNDKEVETAMQQVWTSATVAWHQHGAGV